MKSIKNEIYVHVMDIRTRRVYDNGGLSERNGQRDRKIDADESLHGKR